MRARMEQRVIGYTKEYSQIWQDNAINISKLKIKNLISAQSSEIAQGVMQNGWGDQGVFVGFAQKGHNNLNQELYLAQKRQCPKYCVNEKTGFRYFFLYLDSVFKYKNKLVHNQAPIMNWLCPFLLNFHQ